MIRDVQSRKKKKAKKNVWNKTPQMMKFIKKIKVPQKGMDSQCVARLRAKGIRFQLLSKVKHVNTPIRIKQKSLGGVLYRRAWNNKTAPFILNCKMVENLILAGPYLRRYGIASAYWTSAWRYSFIHGKKKLSNHVYGNAIDITAIDGGFGYASLSGHWERGCGGCGRNCKTKKGRVLRAFSCATRGRKLFKAVLNPDYDALHSDHFHLGNPAANKKLKVKIKAKHLAETKSSPKSNGSVVSRNHWVKGEVKRDWEPPRSRPPHY